jgi:hypothetical protein
LESIYSSDLYPITVATLSREVKVVLKKLTSYDDATIDILVGYVL